MSRRGARAGGRVRFKLACRSPGAGQAAARFGVSSPSTISVCRRCCRQCTASSARRGAPRPPSWATSLSAGRWCRRSAAPSAASQVQRRCYWYDGGGCCTAVRLHHSCCAQCPKMGLNVHAIANPFPQPTRPPAAPRPRRGRRLPAVGRLHRHVCRLRLAGSRRRRLGSQRPGPCPGAAQHAGKRP